MGIIEAMKDFGKSVLRKKPVPCNPLATDLARCLGLVDLTYLSVGAMIGVGVYVTMGQLTREAGPSIVLSYFLGGCASVLSALCYAELASRIPIAGSSYQFTYMAMGEFWGFFVGWNIALEHAIGSAAISRAVSGYIDYLCGNVIRTYLEAHTPMPGGFLSTYPDFVSAGYIMIIVIVLVFGVKISSRANIFFASLNLLICCFIIVSAMFLGNKSYWTDANHGGFFPHSFSATISGAATLIFAYIGYEVVSAAAEEAANPRRNIPLSLIISIFGVMLIYVSVAASFVSMTPWYNASISAPFSDVYEEHGWYWAKYLISVGIIVASTAANIAATLAVPRYIFAMARDGLLMSFLATVNTYTEVPVYATLFGGAWCVLLTLIFSLKDLINFMSIGQLIACIFVATIVMKLRYQPLVSRTKNEIINTSRNTGVTSTSEASESTKLMTNLDIPSKNETEKDEALTGTLRNGIRDSILNRFLIWTDRYEPGSVPVASMYAAITMSVVVLTMLLFDFVNIVKWWYLTLIIIFGFMIILCLAFMMMFKQDDTITTYKIPFAPLSPFLSVVVNFALIMKLDVETWIRLGVWMTVGLILYFGYGYSHSKAKKTASNQSFNEQLEDGL